MKGSRDSGRVKIVRRALIGFLGAAAGGALPAAARASTRQAMDAKIEEVMKTLSPKPEDALSHPQRTFLCVWWLEAEVNNGGFDQYFLNASGRHAPACVGALREIGATKCAEIARQALSVVNRPDLDWNNDEARQDAVLALDGRAQEALGKLDDQFYAYPDDLTARLYAYVASRPAEF
jgi:hypothetical protein